MPPGTCVMAPRFRVAAAPLPAIDANDVGYHVECRAVERLGIVLAGFALQDQLRIFARIPRPAFAPPMDSTQLLLMMLLTGAVVCVKSRVTVPFWIFVGPV